MMNGENYTRCLNTDRNIACLNIWRILFVQSVEVFVKVQVKTYKDITVSYFFSVKYKRTSINYFIWIELKIKLSPFIMFLQNY